MAKTHEIRRKAGVKAWMTRGRICHACGEPAYWYFNNTKTGRQERYCDLCAQEIDERLDEIPYTVREY